MNDIVTREGGGGGGRGRKGKVGGRGVKLWSQRYFQKTCAHGMGGDQIIRSKS